MVEALLVEERAHEAVGHRGVDAKAAQVRRLQELSRGEEGVPKDDVGVSIYIRPKARVDGVEHSIHTYVYARIHI